MGIDTLSGVYTELFDTVAYESDATGALAYRRVQAIRQLMAFNPREVENGQQRIRYNEEFWAKELEKVEAFWTATKASNAGNVVYPQFANWGQR